jgi:hypothetical protein
MLAPLWRSVMNAGILKSHGIVVVEQQLVQPIYITLLAAICDEVLRLSRVYTQPRRVHIWDLP